MKTGIFRTTVLPLVFLVAGAAQAQKPARRLPERAPVRAPASRDTAGVRAVLERWKEAVETGDSARAVNLFSERFVHPMADQFRSGAMTLTPGRAVPPLSGRAAASELVSRLVLGRFGAPKVALADQQIAFTDSTAVADSVITASSFGAGRVALTLRKEDSGWLITAFEHQSEMPSEYATPGLGASYVELLEQWTSTLLTWVQETLRVNPPNGGERSLRERALLLLDEPLHVGSAPELAPVRIFHRENISRAVAEMRSERVTEGATIWKLYNHGWVIRTRTHTWAHDFYEGNGAMAMSDDQIDAILSQIEALFCSHWHGDHTSPVVIRKALAKGIPVHVGPLPEGEWGAGAMGRLSEGLDSTTVRRLLTVVPLGGSGEVRTTKGTLPYHAYPGHQGTFPNCVFTIAADGMTFMQTGDQSNRDDFAWIDRVKDERTVDVLLPNVWTDDLARMIRGVRPRMLIPGHENELGHNFEHREPYAQAFEKLEQERDVEWHVLAWGERVHIPSR